MDASENDAGGVVACALALCAGFVWLVLSPVTFIGAALVGILAVLAGQSGERET